ncbi:MAG: hypothetical protein WD871_03975 [Xanthobacteraceae bacterium]
MNSPSHRNYRPDEPLQQHPGHQQYPAHQQPAHPHPAHEQRVHEPPAEVPWDEQPPIALDAPPLRTDQYDPVWVEQNEVGLAQSELDRLEQIITSENFRVRQRRFPNFAPLPPPPIVRKSGGLRWTVGTFAVLLATSSLVALHVTGSLPVPAEWSASFSDQGARLASLFAAAPETKSDAVNAPIDAAANKLSLPRLVVNGASAENNEEILLGVGVESPRDGTTAVISGLAQGTTLSAGKSWGATGWIVPASELATTMLRPPAGFSGTMEYSVALQLADSSVVDRQSMRLEWAAPSAQLPAPAPTQAKAPAAPPAPAAPAASTPPAPPTQTAARNIDPQELALMVKRGEDLLNSGDIASARLLLRRAAEARDARAAFALAGSYDPIVLNRLRVHGSTPDVMMARDWYEKAKQYGSREAPQRLELLASQYR